jgi:hypothetical protein
MHAADLRDHGLEVSKKSQFSNHASGLEAGSPDQTKTQEEITEDSCKKAKKVVHSALPDLPPEPEVAGPVATVCHES